MLEGKNQTSNQAGNDIACSDYNHKVKRLLERIRDDTAEQAERDLIHATMQKLLCRTYKEFEERRLATISLFYLADKPMTVREIARKFNIAIRTVYKDIDATINRLAVAIYGLNEVDEISSSQENCARKGVAAYRHAVRQLLERVRGCTVGQEEGDVLRATLQKLHSQTHKVEDKRRLAVIALYYLADRPMTSRDIGRKFNIAHRTVYNDIDAAINQLTIALYGIYGIDWEN